MSSESYLIMMMQQILPSNRMQVEDMVKTEEKIWVCLQREVIGKIKMNTDVKYKGVQLLGQRWRQLGTTSLQSL